jgi:hypothetical protein
MTRRPELPFRPTPDGLRTWLEEIPAENRIELCLFLVTLKARSTVADQIDATIAELVEDHTYAEVGKHFGWTKSNVQRRVTRHRQRTGRKRPPRPRRGQATPDDGTASAPAAS